MSATLFNCATTTSSSSSAFKKRASSFTSSSSSSSSSSLSLRLQSTTTSTSLNNTNNFNGKVGGVFVVKAATSYSEKNLGSATVRGTVRKNNEDRLAATFNQSPQPGKPSVIISTFDGHGGDAVSDWLSKNLHQTITKNMNPDKFPLEALTESCIECDEVCIAPPEGFWASFGERGIGGAKCGSTLALAAIVDGNKLCTANVGDARVLLIRDGKTVQLSVDHIPDDENERKRIDRGNPNLRKSMVEFTNGTWRVGGVLALSRAFGDAFLKTSGKFEGIGEKNADYGSGFGLNAEPDCAFEQLTEKDTWLLCATDGLFENEVRGGGGGLTNEKIADMLNATTDPQTVAKELIAAAVKAGSTDDITIQLLKL